MERKLGGGDPDKGKRRKARNSLTASTQLVVKKPTHWAGGGVERSTIYRDLTYLGSERVTVPSGRLV